MYYFMPVGVYRQGDGEGAVNYGMNFFIENKDILLNIFLKII